jgi:uncharacterized protein
MDAVKTYFIKWIKALAEFDRYRNTTVAVLAVCFTTLVLRYRTGIPVARGQLSLPGYNLINGLVFFAVPLLTALFLRPADRFGLRAGNVRTWLVDGVLAWLVLLVLIFLFARSPEFLRYYPMYKPAAAAWTTFFYYEGTQLVYMFGWEFLFRGYLFFATRREIGTVPALLLQMVPFAMLHAGKPELEAYGSIPAGIFLGLIALRANSFLPCALLHFAVAFTMDLLAVLSRGIIQAPTFR